MLRHGGNRLARQSRCSIITRKTSLASSEFQTLIPDYQSLCRILSLCKRSSEFKTVIDTHSKIIKLGYGKYPSVVASLMSSYVYFNRLDVYRKILDRIICWDFDLVNVNLVIESLMRFGECSVADKVFDKMPDRDVVTWNSMIGGCVRNARFEDALRYFWEMLRLNVEPDGYTFASIISGCARLGAVSHAEWVHGVMIEKRIKLNFILNAALIDMYSKCGKLQIAREVFDSVECNNVSVWNAMINGLAIHGLALDAIAVFEKMVNVLPDSITFVGILTACSHCGLVEQGRKYFNLMRSQYSIEPQIEHYGTMVDLLGRTGLLEEAYGIIKAMPTDPDVVIWRTLLSACRTFKNPELGEVALANISRLKSGDYVLLSNIYCSLKIWDSAAKVREMMKNKGIRKKRGKSWVEFGGVIHHFKAGDRSRPENEATYKVLEGLIQKTKLDGFVPATELVLMDVSEEEKEENLNYHSEKLALAYSILKTSPGTEIRISKNLRICHDCHGWIKIVSKLLSRVVIVRDRIRFHRFEGGLCSCGDYW